MIAVIDYGVGNLGSITKALEYVGASVVLTNDPGVARQAEKLVLPGVGAFGDGMKNLRERGWLSVLEEEVRQRKKPFLGVCLGMQLLAKKSYEFGEHEGLGWVNAEVRKLEVAPLKVPQVGWNTVLWTREHPLLSGVPKQSDFYFVHSYELLPEKNGAVIGIVEYGGDIVAAVAWENVFATQFHPEKSQKDGLKILENFMKWSC